MSLMSRAPSGECSLNKQQKLESGARPPQRDGLPLPEHLADLGSQLPATVGLAEQLHPGIEAPLMDNGVLGIAGGIQDPQRRPAFLGCMSQFPTIHAAGQHHIGMIRKKNYPSIRKKLWGGALWSPAYFAGSCGGAPIEIIRQYIEQQQTPH